VALWFVGMKKLKIKSAIAFGPFLVLGTWAASLWGDKIIRWLNF
jgi:prepilin signal peptidase PulO-like enzyme (type II secretory pathway)